MEDGYVSRLGPDWIIWNEVPLWQKALWQLERAYEASPLVGINPWRAVPVAAFLVWWLT